MPAKKMTKNDEIKAIALFEAGFNNTKVANMFGVSRHSIARLKTRYEAEKVELEQLDVEVLPLPENDSLPTKQASIELIKRDLGNSCHHILNKIAGGMTQDKVNDSNLRDLAVSFGIMSDKMGMFKDISTTTVDHKHSLVQDIRASAGAK